MSSTIYEAAESQGVNARGSLQSVDVPAWEVNGAPAKVYYYPGLSVDEWVHIGQFITPDGNGSVSLSWEGIFQCAGKLLRDVDGRLLFGTDAQFQRLREKYDPVVILDIMNRSDIFKAFLDASVDSAKKL